MQWAPRTSAIYRAIHPERAEWGATEYILADLYDALAGIAKGLRLVKSTRPYPRPGDKTRRRLGGKKPMSLTEARAFLAARRRGLSGGAVPLDAVEKIA